MRSNFIFSKARIVVITLVSIVIPSLLINNFVNAQTVTNRKVQGFPWKIGTTWKYSQDLHGSVNNALDFGTPNGRPGDVYSVDGGTVYRVANNCTIIVKREDGLYMGYHHVKPDSGITPGKPVSYQTKLGTTSLCGGSGGHHSHFWLYDQSTLSNHKGFNPIGFLFGDWQLTKERDSSEALGRGADPILGYDYVLRKGTTVACAGSTIQNGGNICTTKLLTNP